MFKKTLLILVVLALAIPSLGFATPIKTKKVEVIVIQTAPTACVTCCQPVRNVLKTVVKVATVPVRVAANVKPVQTVKLGVRRMANIVGYERRTVQKVTYRTQRCCQ
jgi:hypothetical protein